MVQSLRLFHRYSHYGYEGKMYKKRSEPLACSDHFNIAAYVSEKIPGSILNVNSSPVPMPFLLLRSCPLSCM